MTKAIHLQLMAAACLLCVGLSACGCTWQRKMFGANRFADAEDPAYLLAAQKISPQQPAPVASGQQQLAADSRLLDGQQPAGPAVTPQTQGTMLQVSGVTPGAGPIRVAVFDSAASFPKRESATQKLQIDSSGAVVTQSLTLPGKPTALAVYQDLNNDGSLNRNAFGMPTEPYGFSNNAAAQMGPPSFGDAAVAANTSSVQVTLKR